MRKDGKKPQRRYYDNSLICKVTKERRGGGGGENAAAIWAPLIVFYADRSCRSTGDSWKRRSRNVTGGGGGVRLMKETSAWRDEEAGRRYTTSQHNY